MHKPPELTESPFKGKTGIARIIQATWNSLAGLADAWKHESAFRQEVLLAIVLVPSAFFLPVMPVEKALLIAVVLLVLVVELLNSSVEAAIDRISFDHHNLSKRAKDIGSAAVLVALALMTVVWVVILAK
ncbi:Diacylglycerol kinase [Usitatibacter rugosus]|uniref:Diacylglycerol kinase n=1 Tax=Usitatibacter rugosus TaxID=2732067 RepID=A0A6M4H310_9PROT|nr:diacylglycerol kinase [Usitatibacter rugosus]QJR12207.1 Diacylglycerol kinase [Usitatibacter rugosus]